MRLRKLITLLCVNAVAFGMCGVAHAASPDAFADIAKTDYFYPAVEWGMEAGITTGVDETHFAPTGEVTRAQAATFIWRMAGEPAPNNTETFSDVEAGSWYEKAVQWAVENKITNGTGDGLFSPDLTCDRAMCLTMLYRMKGSTFDAIAEMDAVDPEREDLTLEDWGNLLVQELITAFKEGKGFTDVHEGDYFELPVAWGSLGGILTEDNTDVDAFQFKPYEPCVRSQMISFLYQTKLMEDAENEPEIYEFGPVSVAIPQEYSELVYKDIKAIGDGDDGIFITVSERASREAAEKMGEDPEGAGVLFSIGRVSEAELHDLLCGDMSGAEVFAKDENGKYYIYYHPTDVRFMRETPEQMTADQEIWTELNTWAYGSVREAIILNSEGLTPVSFTNTDLDIDLARVLYKDGTKYTVSTNEFGPLEPGSVDAKPYVEALLSVGFEYAEGKEAPDGEYVVLSFPDEDVRYDFFYADGNLVREVRGENETLYKCAYPDEDITCNEVMQGWYYAIAESAGKKKASTELDPFIGSWAEKIAGRGMLTIEKSVAPDKVEIEASWPDSASVMNTWKITASLAEDGKLVYKNGVHTVTEFGEDGTGDVTDFTSDESGTFAVSEAGELTWTAEAVASDGEGAVFIKN